MIRDLPYRIHLGDNGQLKGNCKMGTTSLKTRTTEEDSQCVWMQAGVVGKKICKIGYGCSECLFDRVMQRVADENSRLREIGLVSKGKRGEIISWKEKLKDLPISKRPCIHHLKGRIHFKSCTHEYQCGNCEFDQYFYDQYSVHAVIHPVDVLEIKGFNIPQGYYFHRGHTWVKIEEGSSVMVGIDDFALRLLGPLDRIEAPLMGKEVKQDSADIKLSRGSNHATVPSPVSGVVTSINSKLRERGSLANKDPYADGWVMSVHSNNLRQDLKNLMINKETRDFMGDQVERLYEVIEDVTGPLAVDGGHLGHDIYGNMPQLGWERLTKLFLNP